MKICIDAYHLLAGCGGITTYTKNLVDNLLKIDTKNEYILFFNYFREEFIKPQFNAVNLKIKKFKFPKKILIYSWIKLNFPQIEYIVGKIDIFHSHHFILPAKRNCKLILTVHDVGYIKHPEYYADKKFNDYGYKFLLPNSIKRADLIICDSEFTKTELLDVFNVVEDKVKVIHLGVDEKLFDNIEKNYTDNYLLYIVGTYEPRKNLERLIEAYRIIHNKIDYKLIIQIGAGNLPKEILQKVSGLEDKIVFKGKLELKELYSLIKNATIFIYPSLYEGFGLPVLEAMAAGVPVITSNYASMQEVAKDAALLIDTKSIQEIKEAIIKLTIDDNLREELSKKGKQRAKEFTWHTTAIKTLKAYEEIV